MKIPVLLVFILASVNCQDSLKSGEIIDILKLLLSNSGNTKNIPTNSAPKPPPAPTKYTGPGSFPDYYEDDISVGTHPGDNKIDKDLKIDNDYDFGGDYGDGYGINDNPENDNDYDIQTDTDDINQIENYDEAGTEFESPNYEDDSEDFNNLSQNKIDDAYFGIEVLLF